MIMLTPTAQSHSNLLTSGSHQPCITRT